MKIENITVGEILDSCGGKTIEVTVRNNVGPFSTQLPSGKSRGKNEAAVLGRTHAREILERGLKEAITEKEFNTISDLDKFLIEYDGTKDKSKIGGDLSLGISISFARALAGEQNIELWEVLRKEFFKDIDDEIPPTIFSNMIEGGAHANTNLDIQEYWVVAKTLDAIRITIDNLKKTHEELGKHLRKKYRLDTISLGDEKGYALNFKNNYEPIENLEEVIAKLEFEEQFSLGLDAAATDFQEGKGYVFEGKEISSEKLKRIYNKYIENSKLMYAIEDPFAEGDLEGFEAFKRGIEPNKLIVGDDLTVTNSSLIEKYADSLINGVIIKPNQIGTVMETCEALAVAGEKDIYRIVSHRAGEVDDAFLIHFAKASGAEGVKIGAPVGERLVKFDELVRLYS